MSEYINSWSKWVILKGIYIAFRKKSYFRRIKDLAKESGKIQLKYLYIILGELEKRGIIETKREGDIKSITLKDRTKLKDELINTNQMQEVLGLQTIFKDDFLVPGLKVRYKKGDNLK